MKNVDSSKHGPSWGADQTIDPLSICWFAPSDGHAFLLTTWWGYDPHLHSDGDRMSQAHFNWQQETKQHVENVGWI